MSLIVNSLYVFLGGGLGSVLRFLLSFSFSKLNLKLWLSTLIVNIIGALVMLFLNSKVSLNESHSLLIKTGLLGGLTTFSTFSYEVISSFRGENYMEAIAILLLNIIFGIVIGIWVFR